MRYVQVENPARGAVLGHRVGVADRWPARLRGLLARPRLHPGGGLLLTPCRAVHTLGLPYPIDVAFLDHNGRAVAVYREIPPGARTRWHRVARSALELPAGTLEATGTLEGDTLVWKPVHPERAPEERP